VTLRSKIKITITSFLYTNSTIYKYNQGFV